MSNINDDKRTWLTSKGFASGNVIDDWYNYWKNASGLADGDLSDHMYKALEDRGYSGTLSDKLLSWSRGAISKTTGTLSDAMSMMFAVIDKLRALGTLTFYNNLRGGDINADYGLGSLLATFTASRDSTHPATYVDTEGVIHKTETDDIGRFIGGYYDATGFHRASGLLLEGASTNLCLQTSDLATTWVLSPNTSVDVGITTPDGTDGINNEVIVTSTNNGIYQGGIAVVAETKYTWSWFSYAGTLTGAKYAIYDESNAGFIQVDQAYTAGSGKWVRYAVTFTTPVGCVSLRVYPLRGSGTTGTIHIWGSQIEAQAYPSSFIPTTTAALTRNAESLSYPVADNFAGGTDNALRFDGTDDVVTTTAPGFDETSDFSIAGWVYCEGDITGDGDLFGSPFGQMTYTSNIKGAGFRRDTNHDLVAVFGDDSTANTIVLVADIATTNKQKWYHVALTHNSSTNECIAYVNGVAKSPVTQDVIAAGLNFEIGESTLNHTNSWWYGMLKDIQIYDGVVLSQANIDTIYAGGTVTGITARYETEDLAFGATELTDTVGSNDGTITGATVVSTTHAGTILMKYRPVMLPDELPSTWLQLFQVYKDDTNYWRIKYADNEEAFPYVHIGVTGGGVNTWNTAVSWTRYDSHTIVATYDTSDGVLGQYNDGSLRDSSSGYNVPVGSLPASFQIQPTAGQAMILEGIGLWSDRLDADSVEEANNILT